MKINIMTADVKKMVNAVLKKLDWNLVMNFYSSTEFLRVKTGKKYTLEIVKKELLDLVKFMVDTGASELHHEPWIIFWNSGGDKIKQRLEIAFVPTHAVGVGDEVPDNPEEPMTDDDMERSALESLLEKNLAAENYELCAILKKRLDLLDNK